MRAFLVGDGARGRTDATGLNQGHRVAQPTPAPHEFLRRPVWLLSNLFAFPFALFIFPGAIATTLACLATRQWIKASIAGGVVAGMVVSAWEWWV
jgi:hypothetical protein